MEFLTIEPDSRTENTGTTPQLIWDYDDNPEGVHKQWKALSRNTYPEQAPPLANFLLKGNALRTDVLSCHFVEAGAGLFGNEKLHSLLQDLIPEEFRMYPIKIQDAKGTKPPGNWYFYHLPAFDHRIDYTQSWFEDETETPPLRQQIIDFEEYKRLKKEEMVFLEPAPLALKRPCSLLHTPYSTQLLIRKDLAVMLIETGISGLRLFPFNKFPLVQA